MKTWVHFVVCLILAGILFPIYGWKVLFILVGGVLIDVDHYLWYAYKYRKFNLADSYNFFLKNMETKDFTSVIGILIIFHTLEFLLMMVLLSFYYELAFIFTIGLLSHYLLDSLFLYFVAKRVIADYSIIHWLYKNKLEIQKV